LEAGEQRSLEQQMALGGVLRSCDRPKAVFDQHFALPFSYSGMLSACCLCEPKACSSKSLLERGGTSASLVCLLCRIPFEMCFSYWHADLCKPFLFLLLAP
jgi:hypothetical protein